MTRPIAALDEIAPRYEALFCDLWGCLHNGVEPYPAAVAALQAFRAGGGHVVLMTNAPRPNALVITQLDRLGVPRDAWDLVVSSGDAAQYAMFAGTVGTRVWHLGPPKDDGFFTMVPEDAVDFHPIERVALEEAEGIVCTGPFDDQSDVPEDYRGQFLHAKARGLKLLCANPDLVVDLGEKRIYCAGALAALYEEMGGESLYYGKPWPPIYDLARRRLTALTGRDLPKSAILAVGDGIATDIRGGEAEGLDTLFVTGGLAAEQFGPDVENPEEALWRDWLTGQGAAPTYVIGRLR